MTTLKHSDGRRAERIRCRIEGSFRFINQILEVRIVDISRFGMALKLSGWTEARPGSEVRITTQEFGLIQGRVRWYRAGMMGVQIDETSNTAAQIAAYFKFFHNRGEVMPRPPRPPSAPAIRASL